MAGTTRWYEPLSGRPADARPLNGSADRYVSPYAWLQVFESPEHAGRTLVNLVVADLDRALSDLAGRGITAGETRPGSRGCGSPPCTTPTATGSP
ncbi:hypothetical protein ACIBCU_15195 [Streptomyces sp. NPDC051064]|uniref:hypothetical protein n=1 Tax=Streptomyces sp. NPDC051064 TaxID=3365641 RepID=UPI00378CB8FE